VYAQRVYAGSHAVEGDAAAQPRPRYTAEVTSVRAATGARRKVKLSPVLRHRHAAETASAASFADQLQAMQGPLPMTENDSDTSSEVSFDIPNRQRSPLVPPPRHGPRVRQCHGLRPQPLR